MTVRKRSGERGMALGLVLVLITVLLLAGSVAAWSLRSEIGAAGSDTLSRQLYDCAERGLAFGKLYFSNTNIAMNDFLSTDLCAAGLPCYPNGPFHSIPTTPAACGTAVSGYPNGTLPDNTQLLQNITVGSRTLQFQVAVYDDADESSTTQNYACDLNSQVVVWASCRDLVTGQKRTASAVLQLTGLPSSDYIGQAGHGFRNQGNAN
ncbi:MAG TPA: hypothetical protein VKN99_05345 [Polyangia bacterium]|nr:hypothetical protein [Polyangia bacterium]